jgi:hypothetical protein
MRCYNTAEQLGRKLTRKYSVSRYGKIIMDGGQLGGRNLPQGKLLSSLFHGESEKNQNKEQI